MNGSHNRFVLLLHLPPHLHPPLLVFLFILVLFLLQLMDCGVWCEGFAPQSEENSELGEIEVFEVGEQDAPGEKNSPGPLHQKKMPPVCQTVV